MAIVTTDNQHYTHIANAIREKNGEETQYLPAQLAQAIADLSTSDASAVHSGRFTGSVDTGLDRIHTFVVARYAFTAQSSGTLWACLWYVPEQSAYCIAVMRQVYSPVTGKTSYSMLSNTNYQLTDSAIRNYLVVEGGQVRWVGTSTNNTHLNGVYWWIAE